MNTEVLPADPASIARAASLLRQGRLVAFPTETVYGLGANALSAEAVRGIFEAKGRPAVNPLIVHVADLETVRGLVTDWPARAEALARAFWPGPLTLILPRSERVPDAVTAGGPTVGVRMPAHPVALALLREAGVPVAAPSANRSTELSPTRAEHVLKSLTGRIDLVLDGGPTPGGVESTVLDVTVQPPRLLRPGLVTPAQLAAVVGEIQGGVPGVPDGEPLRSPGLMSRHYAPRTPLTVVEGDAREVVRALALTQQPVGWLPLGERRAPHHDVVVVAMPEDPTAYAAGLYDVLHRLDGLGLGWLVAELPPATPEWLAVRDRLTRAATGPAAGV